MSSPLKHLGDDVESLAGSADALEIEPSWPANALGFVVLGLAALVRRRQRKGGDSIAQ